MKSDARDRIGVTGKSCEQFAIGDIPQPNRFVGAAAEDLRSVRADGHRDDWPLVAHEFPLNLAIPKVHLSQLAIGAAGNESTTVRKQIEGRNLVRVRNWSGCLYGQLLQLH